MNIFATSPDPVKCAQQLDDRRVNKMASEACQLACTAVHIALPDQSKGDNMLWKPTHANHPCAIWTRENQSNFRWLVTHGIALGVEWRIRRLWKAQQHREKIDDRPHATQEVLLHVAKYMIHLPVGDMTPFVNCTDHKDVEDVHLAYMRQLSDKWFAEYKEGFDTKFTGRPTPPFYMLTWPIGEKPNAA